MIRYSGPPGTASATSSDLQAELAGIAEIAGTAAIRETKCGDAMHPRRNGGDANGGNVKGKPEGRNLHADQVQGKRTVVGTAQTDAAQGNSMSLEAVRFGQQEFKAGPVRAGPG